MIQYALLLLSSSSLVLSYFCTHRGIRHPEGETWISNRHFLMRCNIGETEWSADVIGCVSSDGRNLAFGEDSNERGVILTCIRLPSGKVQYRKKARGEIACEGHSNGDFWISENNLKKTCRDGKTETIECISNNGVPVSIGSTIFEGGALLRCERIEGGTIVFERRRNQENDDVPNTIEEFIHEDPVPSEPPTTSLPSTPTPSSAPLPPAPLPPSPRISRPGPPAMTPPTTYIEKMRKLRLKGGVDSDEEDEDNEEEEERGVHSENGQTVEKDDGLTVTVSPPIGARTCFADGAVRQPEETWVWDKKFTKKCTPNGAVIILNCVVNMNEHVTINVDSTIKIGKKIFSCTRQDGTVIYEERIV